MSTIRDRINELMVVQSNIQQRLNEIGAVLATLERAAQFFRNIQSTQELETITGILIPDVAARLLELDPDFDFTHIRDVANEYFKNDEPLPEDESEDNQPDDTDGDTTDELPENLEDEPVVPEEDPSIENNFTLGE